jgi:kynureninase
LTAAGVIGDWREPDILRLAPTPLYNSYSDVFNAVDALACAIRP